MASESEQTRMKEHDESTEHDESLIGRLIQFITPHPREVLVMEPDGRLRRVIC